MKIESGTRGVITLAAVVAAAALVSGSSGCGGNDSASGGANTGGAGTGAGTGAGETTLATGGAGTGGLGTGGTPGTGGSQTGGSSASGGGGAGGGVSCLDPSVYNDLFTVADDDLCVIAAYEGDGDLDFHVNTVSFGAQGGPVIVGRGTADGSVDVVRYHPHSGAPQGSFTITTDTAAVNLPGENMAFLAAQALDLGFFGWTAIGYAGPYPATQGDLILLDGTAEAKRYPVNGLFALGSIVDSSDAGRLIYTGLSKLDDAAASENALFAADSCGTTAMNPALEPGTSLSCGAPQKIFAWGDASGPLAVDALGNAFAVMTSFTGPQVARGFAKAEIKRGQGPTEGTMMFTLDGFGSALAAIAPTASDPGILAFQPSSATTYEALDVVAQRYTVGSGTLTKMGDPTPLLTLTTEDTAVSMASDPDAHVWISATRGAATDHPKLVFVVLARKP